MMDDATRRSTGQMWGLGDYDLLADRLAPAATAVADLAGPGNGRSAVDLAAGTGSLAIELSGRGWQVSAVDISPALVAAGEETSRALGHVIGWHEASFDDLPFEDESFTLAASSFGLIFAPDPAAALHEVRRVLMTRGRIALSAWTPASYIAQMTEVMSRFMPGVPTAAPFEWGDLAVQHGWLSEHFTQVDTTVRAVPWVFGSPAEATDFMFTNSPGHVAALRTAADDGPAMREAVRDHLASIIGGPGRVDISAEYVVTIARAR